MSTHRYTDLDAVVDEIHRLLDAWEQDGSLSPALDANGEIVLRLAVHEWIANLVQHAAFGERETEITLRVDVLRDAVDVAIEDTSSGFDLLGQLEAQESVLRAPAPSERGRGLLMLITCTEDLDYTPAGDGRQRLSFRLRNPTDAVFAGLFRPEDAHYDPGALHGDPALASGDGLASAPPQPNAR